MHEAEKLSLVAIGRFVEASEGIRFESEGLEREVELYGKQEYARLASISVAHLYNLRRSRRYRERRLN